MRLHIHENSNNINPEVTLQKRQVEDISDALNTHVDTNGVLQSTEATELLKYYEYLSSLKS